MEIDPPLQSKDNSAGIRENDEKDQDHNIRRSQSMPHIFRPHTSTPPITFQYSSRRIRSVLSNDKQPASTYERTRNGSASILVDSATITSFASRVPKSPPFGSPPLHDLPVTIAPSGPPIFVGYPRDNASLTANRKRKPNRLIRFEHFEEYFISEREEILLGNEIDIWTISDAAAHEANMKALEVEMNAKRRRKRKERDWEDCVAREDRKRNEIRKGGM